MSGVGGESPLSRLGLCALILHRLSSFSFSCHEIFSPSPVIIVNEKGEDALERASFFFFKLLELQTENHLHAWHCCVSQQRKEVYH